MPIFPHRRGPYFGLDVSMRYNNQTIIDHNQYPPLLLPSCSSGHQNIAQCAREWEGKKIVGQFVSMMSLWTWKWNCQNSFWNNFLQSWKWIKFNLLELQSSCTVKFKLKCLKISFRKRLNHCWPSVAAWRRIATEGKWRREADKKGAKRSG